MDKQRYSLMISCPADGDLIVIIEAGHKTKETLRQAFALARAFVLDGQLDSVEAWDRKEDELLSRLPVSQSTIDKPQKRKGAKKNVIQLNNTSRKPRKRS